MTRVRVGAKRTPAVSKPNPTDDAVQAINHWADAPSTAQYDEKLHESGGRFLIACAKRQASALDPFQISLA